MHLMMCNAELLKEEWLQLLQTWIDRLRKEVFFEVPLCRVDWHGIYVRTISEILSDLSST